MSELRVPAFRSNIERYQIVPDMLSWLQKQLNLHGRTVPI